MKKLYISILTALVILAISNTCLVAAPVANSNMGREYLIGSSSLAHWSAGFFASDGGRRLSWDGGGTFDMDFVKGGVYVGYDILGWMTPYCSVAANTVKADNTGSDDTELELGFGVQLNLLDQEIMDPTLLLDRLRINSNVFYARNDADWGTRSAKWRELSASLTASLVNDLDGNKAYWPESTAIYIGPIYSTYISDDLDTEESWGLIGGLRFYFTKRVSLDLSMEKYKLETFSGSLNVRF